MTIFHAWSVFETPDAETHRRMALAGRTWVNEWKAGGVWCARPYSTCRSSVTVGDSRSMPYVSDLINYAMTDGAETDVIAFSNSDVCFAPGLTGWILDTVPRHGAAYTHRWDFKRLDRPLVNEAEVKRGSWYPGSDAFFFTVGWWKAHRDEYPDMILGREQCDEVFRQLVKRHGGVEIKGAIYHEYHESFWRQPGNHRENPGNRHNRILARKWFLKTGYRPNDWEWWKI